MQRLSIAWLAIALAMSVPAPAAFAEEAAGPEQTSAPASAPASTSASSLQLAAITQLAGTWRTEEIEALSIVFEPTANGSAVVERWMAGEKLHSLTIYHQDGDRLLATHYCPQGNQPRLEARGPVQADGTLHFSFADATDLDPAESYQHDLSITHLENGQLRRAETYHGPNGPEDEDVLLLTRVSQ